MCFRGQGKSTQIHIKDGHVERRGTITATCRGMCEEAGYDVLALTETHCANPTHGRRLLMSAPTPANDRFSGVALIISDHMARSLTFSGSVSSRIVFARFRGRYTNLTIIAPILIYIGNLRLDALLDRSFAVGHILDLKWGISFKSDYNYHISSNFSSFQFFVISTIRS